MKPASIDDASPWQAILWSTLASLAAGVLTLQPHNAAALVQADYVINVANVGGITSVGLYQVHALQPAMSLHPCSGQPDLLPESCPQRADLIVQHISTHPCVLTNLAGSASL